MRALFCLPDAWAWLAPAAAVEYLEAAHPLASNHDLGMAIPRLDLPDWPARGVKLMVARF